MPIKFQETMPLTKTKVYKEFNMTTKGVSQDIVALKEWLMKQPHLPYIKGVNVDRWFENYLVMNKNSLERAKENLDMYFTVRVLLPEIYTLRDPLHPDIRRSCEVMGLAVLPQLTPEGRRVIMFSHFKDSADDFDPTVMLKRLTMLYDIILQEGVDFIGLEVLVDTKMVCLGHLAKYNLNLLKKTVDYGLKAYPNRYFKIHIVNPWAMVETGLAFFKPFLSKKLQDRIVVHRTLDDLYRHLPKSMLPENLGGNEPSTKELSDAWQEKLVQYRQWFLSNENIKSDESKRIGKCRFEITAETFGNQGSFRKIEVD